MKKHFETTVEGKLEVAIHDSGIITRTLIAPSGPYVKRIARENKEIVKEARHDERERIIEAAMYEKEHKSMENELVKDGIIEPGEEK